MCNFGRMQHEEKFCESILNLDQWFRRKCRLKIFAIWSSGSLLVQKTRNHFGRGYYDETFCEIIFEFRPVAMEEMLLKGISFLELWLGLPRLRNLVNVYKSSSN